MNQAAALTRRRFLKQSLVFSAALGLASRVPRARAAASAPDDLHFLAVGDFGSGNERQSAVAAAMKRHAEEMAKKPDGLLLIGDNFYSKMPGGVKAERWKTGFEDMYPASHFPGPCWAVLGNHDYHDNAGGEQAQLGYAAAAPGTRWTMPAKWFRVELPGGVGAPSVATLLFLDSNLPTVSGGLNKLGQPRSSLTAAEAAAQLMWLKAQLAGPRAPFTFVIAHHPLYSNAKHGDSAAMIDYLGKALREHRVTMFLCGHDHDLQHLEFEGHPTSFIVSGGGGARSYELKNNKRGPFAQMVYGFTHLQINRDRFIVQHFDANRKSLHAFSKTPTGELTIL